MGVRTVLVNKRAKGIVGPGFLNYILPEGLEVLEGPFEGGESGDRVHKGAKSKPVNSFGSE